jgi:hypothetical protein
MTELSVGECTPPRQVVARHLVRIHFNQNSPRGIRILVPNPSDVKGYVWNFMSLVSFGHISQQSCLMLWGWRPNEDLSDSRRAVIHRGYP